MNFDSLGILFYLPVFIGIAFACFFAEKAMSARSKAREDTSSELNGKAKGFDKKVVLAIFLTVVYAWITSSLTSGVRQSDFEKLLKYLKGKHKKTTIIAHADRLNDHLVSSANRTILFKHIKSLVEKKKGLP